MKVFRGPGFPRSLVLACTLVLAACSGRYVETGGGDGGGAITQTSNPDGATAGSNGLPSHPLGDCQPGFAKKSFPNRACNWLSEQGLCFDTRDQACNCICPTSGGSICSSSGYRGVGEETPIFCDKI